MSEEEPKHVTVEDMIARGEPYATFEDLEGLSDEDLRSIGAICETTEIDEDDSCVPCRALTMLADQVRARLDDSLAAAIQQPLDEEILRGNEEDRPTPPLDALIAEPSPFQETPVVERFAGKVEELSLLVSELLQGPPIPPPNVTLAELGALVVGARKWLQIIDSQDLELAPKQQALRDEIERVVAKVAPQ